MWPAVGDPFEGDPIVGCSLLHFLAFARRTYCPKSYPSTFECLAQGLFNIDVGT